MSGTSLERSTAERLEPHARRAVVEIAIHPRSRRGAAGHRRDDDLPFVRTLDTTGSIS